MTGQSVVLQIEPVAAETEGRVRAKLTIGGVEAQGGEEGLDLVDIRARQEGDRARVGHIRNLRCPTGSGESQL